MVTVWSKTARAELRKAYLFIQLDSPQNAEIVRDDLIDLTIELCKFPEKHPPDKFKKDNDDKLNEISKLHDEMLKIKDDPVRFAKNADMLGSANTVMTADL